MSIHRHVNRGNRERIYRWRLGRVGLHIHIRCVFACDRIPVIVNMGTLDGIEIIKTDSEPASSRFGLPEFYQLQTIDVDGSHRKKVQIKSHVVHYSRIVHMAEGALDSTIEGMSALEQPWNALTDKNKTRGSSAEAYYRNNPTEKPGYVAPAPVEKKNFLSNWF